MTTTRDKAAPSTNKVTEVAEKTVKDANKNLGEILGWWQANKASYPVLSHLAFELLAAHSSTAATERLFSMAGTVVIGERPMTQ